MTNLHTSGSRGRIWRSFGWAWNGLVQMVRYEPNAKIHMIAAFGAICMGFIFQISRVEWLAVIICIGIVLALEAVNSSIERLADSLTHEYDKQIGLVKDMAAGAVLAGSMAAAGVGLVVFLPYFLNLFK